MATGFKGKMTAAAAWAKRRGDNFAEAVQDYTRTLAQWHSFNRQHAAMRVNEEAKVAPVYQGYLQATETFRNNREIIKDRIRNARSDVQGQIYAKHLRSEATYHARTARMWRFNPMRLWLGAGHALETASYKFKMAYVPGVHKLKERHRNDLRDQARLQLAHEQHLQTALDTHNFNVEHHRHWTKVNRPSLRVATLKAFHKVFSA